MSVKSSPRLFVGGLKRNVEKEEMMAEFTQFGEVVDMWIAYDPPGFAFVEFSTDESAQAALKAKHKSMAFDCEIRVEFTKKKGDSKQEDERKSAKPRLFIGGIVDRVEKEDLLPKFEKFGSVTDVWIAHNPPGFAFVEYDNDESANKAVQEMDGTRLFGGSIKVQITKGRKEGRRSRVNDDRGSRSYSRRDDARQADHRRSPYPLAESYGQRRAPPARDSYARGPYARDPYPPRAPEHYTAPSYDHYVAPPHVAPHHVAPHHGAPHVAPPHGGHHDPYGAPPAHSYAPPPVHHDPYAQAPRDPRDSYPPPRDAYYSNPYPAREAYYAPQTTPSDTYPARDPYYAREYPHPESVTARPAPPAAAAAPSRRPVEAAPYSAYPPPQHDAYPYPYY